MIQIINTDVYGLDRAIKCISNSYTVGEIDTKAQVTEKNYSIGKNLGNNLEPHQSHDAYLKGIIVQFDIKYPQYWTPEFQRYHFADIIMSQSTMHALNKMLNSGYDPFNKYTSEEAKELITRLASAYERDPSYENFIKLRSNLPAGFEMWETVTTNYLQLKTIWVQRHNHKLKEDWGVFCNWIENLPKFKELCLDKLIAEEEKEKELILLDPRRINGFMEDKVLDSERVADRTLILSRYIDCINGKLPIEEYKECYESFKVIYYPE